MMNFSIAKCLFSIGGCTTILGNISADTAVSSAGAIGGLGVLTIAVNYTLNLLKKKDEQLMAKDAALKPDGPPDGQMPELRAGEGGQQVPAGR